MRSRSWNSSSRPTLNRSLRRGELIERAVSKVAWGEQSDSAHLSRAWAASSSVKRVPVVRSFPKWLTRPLHLPVVTTLPTPLNRVEATQGRFR